MGTATTRPRTTGEGEQVTTLDVGPGGLSAFIELVPEPPGRIRYRDGSVTIVTPGYNHEAGVERIDEVVKTIVEELEIPCDAAASTLYRRDDLDRGVMPDKSYYIEHQGALVGVDKTVDLRRYPPPDLVIEVVWTHKATGALEICGALGVPEVWVYDLPTGEVQFLLLGPDGMYAPASRSRSFPFLTPADVRGQVEDGLKGESLHLRRRRLRAWVRDVLAPRQVGG